MRLCTLTLCLAFGFSFSVPAQFRHSDCNYSFSSTIDSTNKPAPFVSPNRPYNDQVSRLFTLLLGPCTHRAHQLAGGSANCQRPAVHFNVLTKTPSSESSSLFFFLFVWPLAFFLQLFFILCSERTINKAAHDRERSSTSCRPRDLLITFDNLPSI